MIATSNPERPEQESSEPERDTLAKEFLATVVVKQYPRAAAAFQMKKAFEMADAFIVARRKRLS